MQYKVVVDTNILVSFFITKNNESPVVKVMEKVLFGDLVPYYNMDIILEYIEVLCDRDFGFDEELVYDIIIKIVRKGHNINPSKSTVKMIHEDDRKFYDVYKSEKDIYLITGNIKHFPISPKILVPKKFINIVLDNNVM